MMMMMIMMIVMLNYKMLWPIYNNNYWRNCQIMKNISIHLQFMYIINDRMWPWKLININFHHLPHCKHFYDKNTHQICSIITTIYMYMCVLYVGVSYVYIYIYIRNSFLLLFSMAELIPNDNNRKKTEIIMLFSFFFLHPKKQLKNIKKIIKGNLLEKI